jgi:hypothetical protein
VDEVISATSYRMADTKESLLKPNEARRPGLFTDGGEERFNPPPLTRACPT